MSSLRKSWRVRPKSPPLQPASITLVKNSATAADGNLKCRLVRIGKHVSGMSGCPVSAPTAAAAGGRTFFRSASTAGFVVVVFDPDDGKDQDGSHAFAWRAIHG
jgi:hypothetical protein